jgi:two-component system phosphate regulon sensor histidine kinase PhoR
MINNSLFLTILAYFIIVILSVVLVTVSGNLYLAIIPVFLCIYLSFRLNARVHKSIRLLTGIVSKAGKGDMSGGYTEVSDWEISTLGRAINDMLEYHIRQMNSYRFDREDLKVILDNISEALWIQDKQGKIVWSSLGFSELFPEYQRGATQYFWEIVHEPQVLDYINQRFSLNTKPVREIILNDKYYIIKAVNNPRALADVYILQNIDLLRQTEQMKKDFMINLAHELRTPLTAIKGFAEAVSENTDKDSLRYLSIIRNHTERLINLVSDLQTLASLERLPELNLVPINLMTFLENVTALYQQALLDKGLYLNIEPEGEVPCLKVDPFKFEQIFINLIDNALRYTETGGITIKIKGSDSAVNLQVCDTGKGIEPEHLPRIFERFYVADPSRNRSLSGTGLGLAIVKHGVLLHQGVIDVQSEPGKGTCFSMDFPTHNPGE